MQKDTRLNALTRWITQQLPQQKFSIAPLAGDASFRRYFRVSHDQQTYIAMDAPPEKEDCKPYIAVAKRFKEKGLNVPTILQKDETQGFLLLSDLGDDLYSRILQEKNADQLYHNAIRDLLIIQRCEQNKNYSFPPFDKLMAEELQRFREWYLNKHLHLSLTTKEEYLLNNTFAMLVQSALQQPQVCVHRDYHSRNLLALSNNKVGILDFQDAVWGPISYDLVSLIRDCYVAWPNSRVENWAQNYYEQAKEQKFINVSFDHFLRWFDWMGMQRHLKATYIFSRKFHRDQNPNYLDDIPRTLNYVLTVSEKYPEFKEFRKWFSNVIPAKAGIQNHLDNNFLDPG